METIKYKENIRKIDQENYILTCIGTLEQKQITESLISVNTKQKVMTISSWHTEEKYQHHGYGTENLKEIVKNAVYCFGNPEKVKYIWNGANEYVLEWLKDNFDARCLEDINVIKNSVEDSWNNHIYILDTKKFLDYFIENN